jgi:hypothetical protein
MTFPEALFKPARVSLHMNEQGNQILSIRNKPIFSLTAPQENAGAVRGVYYLTSITPLANIFPEYPDSAISFEPGASSVYLNMPGFAQ